MTARSRQTIGDHLAEGYRINIAHGLAALPPDMADDEIDEPRLIAG